MKHMSICFTNTIIKIFIIDNYCACVLRNLRVTKLNNMEASSSSVSEERMLLPLEKAKSGVWDYFGFPAQGGDFIEKDKKKRTTVFCKLCPKQLRYQGNTTNMIVHLQYHHRSEFDK